MGDTLDNNLRAQLLAGVTQVVDLGGPVSLFDLRDRLATAGGPTPRLDLDVLSAITAGSLPVWAHVDTQTDAAEALAHGVRFLAHPP